MRDIREAGVEKFVDARLTNAHDLVKQLPGPWDFVFQDAGKDWYLNYWLHLETKISPGGCYAAHNVLRPDGRAGDPVFGSCQSQPALHDPL